MSVSVNIVSFVHRSLPLLKWMCAYRHEWLLPDVFAGVALWTVMVPEGMAYSSIVGVPPIIASPSLSPACATLFERICSSAESKLSWTRSTSMNGLRPACRLGSGDKHVRHEYGAAGEKIGDRRARILSGDGAVASAD